MKIVKLTAENFKKLKVVEITPTGAVVNIAGQNASGKSTVLDSIALALGGEKLMPDKPLRKGEKKAHIRLDLGEIIVTRRFTEKGSTVTVENGEGAKYPSPQAMLDAITGTIGFDPMEFSREKPRQQFEMLRRLVKLDVDIDALAAASKIDYDARTDVSRQAKSLSAQTAAILVPDGLPEAMVDVAALMDRMGAAASHNTDVETRKANRARIAEDAVADRARAAGMKDGEEKIVADIEVRAAREIRGIEEQIATLTARMQACSEAASAEIGTVRSKIGADAAALIAKAKAAEARLATAPELPLPIVIDDLRTEIDAANQTNAGVARRNQKQALEVEIAGLEGQRDALTVRIGSRDKQAQDAISRAAMPIPGLSFGDGQVLFNDLPLDQASSAEQLRVSVAIGMAMNPKLRVLLIKEGVFLDDNGLRMVAEMAADKDYQVWLESINATGPMSVMMEDGSVVPTAGMGSELTGPITVTTPVPPPADQASLEI